MGAASTRPPKGTSLFGNTSYDISMDLISYTTLEILAYGLLNTVSCWRDVTLLARRVLPHGELRCAVECYRRRQTHGEQNNTGPYTMCMRSSNKTSRRLPPPCWIVPEVVKRVNNGVRPCPSSTYQIWLKFL